MPRAVEISRPLTLGSTKRTGAADASKLRMVQLDILRGLAILLVLGSHTPFGAQDAGCFAPLAVFLQRFGWTGVDLFFVLSGFLIGGLLFKEIRAYGSLDLRRFFVRRCFKIWPSYYLLVLVAFLLVLIRTHGQFGVACRTMFPNLIYLQNYWPGDRPIGQTWSLAVEEHFYLLLPLFLAAVIQCQSRKYHSRRKAALPAVPIAALGVMAFCLLYRCIVNGPRPYEVHSHTFETHVRLDSLFFGVLLAYIYHFAPDQLAAFARRRVPLLFLGLLFISPMFFLERETTPFVWTFGYTLLSLGYGSILMAMLYIPVDASPAGRLVQSAPLRLIAWVGTYSYTIYLWFAMLADRPTAALFHHLPRFPSSVLWPLSTLVDITLAVAAGVVMGQIVDKPALALRDRLFPGRATALRDTPASLYMPVGTVHAIRED